MNLFLVILNMSITASYVALAVIAGRLLLRRAPKIYSYILWLAVAVRLVIPVSFTSSFSLLRLVQPRTQTDARFMEFVPQEIGMLKYPIVDAGIRGISRFVNSSLPAAKPLASVNPMQIIVWTGGLVWSAGIAVLLLYSVLSFLHIQARVRTATLVKDNIYETDRISTPFVFGFLKPKIYVPTGLSERELSYILLHEQTHIRRRDYLIKPAAYLLLIVHWFNPLMWLAYALMNKDMEMSCDERVVSETGDRIKGSYSETLLSLSVRRSGLRTGSPLAFGESHVKARIRNVLAYRKPSSAMIAVSMLVIAALAAGCTANPTPLLESAQPASQPLYSDYHLDQLMKNKTKYIGNAGKVGGLIGAMPRPEGLEGKGMELQTKAPPYGLTVNYDLTDGDTEWIKGRDASGEVFLPNALLLFCLIDNVDSVTYKVVDRSGQRDGATYQWTFLREQATELLGEDIRTYGTDKISLQQLIDRLQALQLHNIGNAA